MTSLCADSARQRALRARIRASERGFSGERRQFGRGQSALPHQPPVFRRACCRSRCVARGASRSFSTRLPSRADSARRRRRGNFAIGDSTELRQPDRMGDPETPRRDSVASQRLHVVPAWTAAYPAMLKAGDAVLADFSFRASRSASCSSLRKSCNDFSSATISATRASTSRAAPPAAWQDLFQGASHDYIRLAFNLFTWASKSLSALRSRICRTAFRCPRRLVPGDENDGLALLIECEGRAPFSSAAANRSSFILECFDPSGSTRDVSPEGLVVRRPAAARQLVLYPPGQGRQTPDRTRREILPSHSGVNYAPVSYGVRSLF